MSPALCRYAAAGRRDYIGLILRMAESGWQEPDPAAGTPPPRDASGCVHGTPLVAASNCRDLWCGLLGKVVCKPTTCPACPHRTPPPPSPSKIVSS